MNPLINNHESIQHRPIMLRVIHILQQYCYYFSAPPSFFGGGGASPSEDEPDAVVVVIVVVRCRASRAGKPRCATTDPSLPTTRRWRFARPDATRRRPASSATATPPDPPLLPAAAAAAAAASGGVCAVETAVPHTPVESSSSAEDTGNTLRRPRTALGELSSLALSQPSESVKVALGSSVRDVINKHKVFI